MCDVDALDKLDIHGFRASVSGRDSIAKYISPDRITKELTPPSPSCLLSFRPLLHSPHLLTPWSFVREQNKRRKIIVVGMEMGVEGWDVYDI